jgi:hypothetical protein
LFGITALDVKTFVAVSLMVAVFFLAAGHHGRSVEDAAFDGRDSEG